VAVPWLFIWQGLDFTDQGYLLTSYRCFFRQPAVTADSGSVWLTNLIGAAWDALFGWLGVVSVRALWALCMSFGLLLAFQAAKRASNARFAAVAVLATSVFLSDRRETWFSYNTSSSFLFVAAAVCLSSGIGAPRRGRLLAAGSLIGILPFARFPNLLALALLATPCLAALVEAPRRSRLLGDLGVLLLGLAASVVATLGVIYALGQSQQFVSSIRDLFAPAARQSGYGADTLLGNFVKDEVSALAWGFGVCVGGALLALLFRKLPSRVAWLLAVAIAALGALGLAGTNELWRFVVPGTIYWLLSGVALGLWRGNFEQRVLAFTALVIVVIAPLGSNNGIKNAHMGLWLALPLALALLFEVDAKGLAGQGPKLALIGCLALGGEGLHRAASYTYRDSSRSNLLTAVGHPQLRAQFTSTARAKVVREVLSALEQRVAPNDYLLAYEGTPLLQYLTRTRPYLDRAWLMGAVSAEEIARLAADAPRRTGCLPVAVVTKRSTSGSEWPVSARRLEEKEPQRHARLALRAFLRAHAYKSTWSDGFFEILEPPSAGRVSCR
jgi:hypothetical protein